MLESNVLKEIHLAVSSNNPEQVRVFRNNVGTGWVGKSKSYPGRIVIDNPRPLHAGLCEGSSDLIGWTEITITPDMVGNKVAVFTALEIKRDAKSRTSPAQTNFIDRVCKSGGIAGRLHFYESFQNILVGFYERCRKH